jgi:hypothetical protein
MDKEQRDKLWEAINNYIAKLNEYDYSGAGEAEAAAEVEEVVEELMEGKVVKTTKET